MKKRKKLSLLMIFIIISAAIEICAQNVIVTGKILDEEGFEVIGANILIKGSAGEGTVTNMEGDFSLQVNDVAKDVLIISYIGMETQEVPLNGRTQIDIILKNHSLNPSYERVFRNVCEYIFEPKEVMYEVQFYNPTGENTHTGKIGSYNSPEIDRNSSYGLGNSFIKTSGIFYSYYDKNDQRLSTAIATFKIDKNDNVIEIPYNESYNWSPGKWRRNWVASAPKDLENTDVNFILLRYADVLLMYVESVNETDGQFNDLAIECLNQIKRRAYGKAVTTPIVDFDFKKEDFPSQQSVRKYLYMERSRELCFEGFRRFDLIRWNLLKTTIDDFYLKFNQDIENELLKSYKFTAGERFQTGKHELYPIPTYEIRETKNIIKQNPKY